ncbi:amidohydrolase family protein [Tenacibaculum geojense]|uniref:Amidohydrolase family protein n=1 Tax=Tenacibaculum geojense TaxID=915352 RepID=A0ABW3JRC8_9FLAO
MLKKTLTLLLFLSSYFTIYSQTYITNVTIADVEKEQLIANQTVVIENGIISKIKKSNKITIPVNAEVINGENKFLFPGLVDSHIHFFQNGGLYTRPDAINLQKVKSYQDEIELAQNDMEAKLRRYLQNGITSLVDVGATYNFLKQRKNFKNKPYSPTVFMTGPLLTTYKPEVYNNLGDDEPFILTTTPEKGVEIVRDQVKNNADFIKIWYIVGTDGLSDEESAKKNLPIVKAIINEAHKNNLKVAVHATERITAQLAVENGADFLVHSVQDEIVKKDFVQLLKKNKTVLCPSLIVSAAYFNTFGQKISFSNHELLKADPYQLGSLLDLRHISDTATVNRYKNFANSKQSIERIKKREAISKANLKILSDAGVLIASGTDAGNIGTLHASSYLTELKVMKESGMSNWKIIQSSTVNGAKIFDKENELGTVTEGKKANLILLNQNPIENLDHLTKIHTVFNNGKVIKPDSLLKDTPRDLAQRQLNAYNLRNIDAFLEPYADDVEIYTFPNKLSFKGKDIMRKKYIPLFEKIPNLHCQVTERIVKGNIVIDKEVVTVKNRTVEAIAIYHIENGKIKKVYFVD